jgi:quercetin dioxygenase-like cupin family protein
MLKKATILTFCFCAAFASTEPSLPEMRMTPDEIATLPFNNGQIGSSSLPGVRIKVLFGDPSKAGFYAILVFVPAHTSIPAHSHRDNRMAVVVAGSWSFGYGAQFDEKSLKKMPPGSVYSEPGHVNHFARTDDAPSIVQISGYGPTDTVYFDAANDPRSKQK